MASLNCKYREQRGDRARCNCIRNQDSFFCDFENTEFCRYCVKIGEKYNPYKIDEIDKRILK